MTVSTEQIILETLKELREEIKELREQVVQPWIVDQSNRVVRLETQVEAVIGTLEKPGSLEDVQKRVRKLEAWRNGLAGGMSVIGFAFGWFAKLYWK